jgi:hypothetical protein
MSKDPRDMVGKNPTGNPTRSSASKRRQAEQREMGKKAVEERKGRRG